MCLGDSGVELKTGMLDTALDLGINTPPSDRFTFEYTAHCAPITTQGHTSRYLWNSLTDIVPDAFSLYGEDVTDASYIAFRYGPNTILGSNATFVWTNQTYDFFSIGLQLPTPPLLME